VPFLPKHHILPETSSTAIEPVAAAPWGSASIALISWAYIKMLGGKGLNDSSKVALLNANYMASRLLGHYTLRYKNENGRVAHELLIDLAEFQKSAGLKVNDFAKRLQVSLPVIWFEFCRSIPFRIMAFTLLRALGQPPRVCSSSLPNPKHWRSLIGKPSTSSRNIPD